MKLTACSGGGWHYAGAVGGAALAMRIFHFYLMLEASTKTDRHKPPHNDSSKKPRLPKETSTN